MRSKAMKYIYWILTINNFYGLRCRGLEEKLFPVEGQVSRCREGHVPVDLETSTGASSIQRNVLQEAANPASLLPTGTGKLEKELLFPGQRWSISREERSTDRDQESTGRSESLNRDDASYFVEGRLEEGDLDGQEGKRNVGMLRMGKRPVGILRMGRGDYPEFVGEEADDMGQESIDEVGDNDDHGGRAFGALGKRPVELLRMGKRPVGLLRMGKRPVNLLRMGKRPVDLLRMGKRPVNLLRMGKRPVDLLRMG